MSKKSKGNRIHIVLECSEQKSIGVNGISRYTTVKNRKNSPQKLELKKFNHYLRRYTIHKEIK